MTIKNIGKYKKNELIEKITELGNTKSTNVSSNSNSVEKNIIENNNEKSIADDSKLIIEGDLSQCDKYRTNGSPAHTKSGFFDVWKRLGGVKGVYQIEFKREDCIRSGIVKRVLERYEMEEEIYLGEGNKYELDFTFNPFPEEIEEIKEVEPVEV